MSSSIMDVAMRPTADPRPSTSHPIIRLSHLNDTPAPRHGQHVSSSVYTRRFRPIPSPSHRVGRTASVFPRPAPRHSVILSQFPPPHRPVRHCPPSILPHGTTTAQPAAYTLCVTPLASLSSLPPPSRPSDSPPVHAGASFTTLTRRARWEHTPPLPIIHATFIHAPPIPLPRLV